MVKMNKKKQYQIFSNSSILEKNIDIQAYQIWHLLACVLYRLNQQSNLQCLEIKIVKIIEEICLFSKSVYLKFSVE